MVQKKLRIGVLYGGRSGEHEISLISAASVVRNLDPSRFEILPIFIDKAGKWKLQDPKKILEAAQKIGAALPVLSEATLVSKLPYPSQDMRGERIVALTGEQEWLVDVVFPVMHGPLCEDGTIQGLLELAEIPYVGSGVLGSAVGMDKDTSKRLALASGIPVVPWITLKKSMVDQTQDPSQMEQIRKKIADDLGFPCFVKPSNMGSSVGVHKVKDPGSLYSALQDAFRYDLKVLVEKGLEVREIELAVLENSNYGSSPLVSVAGEIRPKHEFYSYEAKYLDQDGAELLIPAQLTSQQLHEVQALAAKVFQALECEGMARVDFFMESKTGRFYLNEINTIPGFTQISMYPKLWEASGVRYQELLTRLIDLAIDRSKRKGSLLREFRRAD